MKIPHCVGIIMDGNRRWAREQGLPMLEGHMRGYEKMKDVVRWAKEAGVGTLIFYAFSTENWNRAPKEVDYLMRIFETALVRELDEIKNENARIRFIGERHRLSRKIQKLMNETEARTKDNIGITVALAISYGGRTEIVHAVNQMRAAGTDSIDEKNFARYLWTHGLPDPDIIIRTGGEKRLSNFLPWQSVYSELFFSDTYWPEFSQKEFQNILKDFALRERRRGK